MQRSGSAGMWLSVVSRMTCAGVSSRRRSTGRACPPGTLPSKGGRAVHRLMISGALSRRPNDRRREQKEPRDMCRAASFLPSSGGCPCLGHCTPSSVYHSSPPRKSEQMFDKIVPFIGLLCERSELRGGALSGGATGPRNLGPWTRPGY